MGKNCERPSVRALLVQCSCAAARQGHSIIRSSVRPCSTCSTCSNLLAADSCCGWYCTARWFDATTRLRTVPLYCTRSGPVYSAVQHVYIRSERKEGRRKKEEEGGRRKKEGRKKEGRRKKEEEGRRKKKEEEERRKKKKEERGLFPGGRLVARYAVRL